MKHAKQLIASAGLALVLGWWCLFTAAPARGQSIKTPDQPTPTMDVDDVRIGMKGYGMTVFQGTKIEPFRVQVVSIVPNATPTRSVIWVRCADERMIESGPVQGMSGSPIYLWEDGEAQTLGEGGKLIGAFAFGYTDSQQCIVGVQPIAYMRDSATRVPEAEEKQDGAVRTRRGSARRTIALLEHMKRLPVMDSLSPISKARFDAILEMMNRTSGREEKGVGHRYGGDMISGPSEGTEASAMMLPIAMGSSRGAGVFGPLLKPMGFMAVANDGGPVAGAPPKEIDTASVAIEPGSVLSVPLVYGDIDLSASGTVTDVLPSGEVLAFGHPMFGFGTAQVPMATGYVHFVIPRRSISFKNTGSLVPIGTLVRDESSAVVGISDVRYTTAPVDVTVNMPNDDSRTYHYQLVNEPMLSAVLLANAALSSVEAIYGVPIESTMRIRAKLRFTGDRELNIDTLVAEGNSANAALELLPPVSVLVQNAYDSLDIESVSLTVDVEEGIREAMIAGARLERSQVAPGEAVSVLVDLQHYGGKQEQRRIAFQLPENLEEGDYTLTISGANVFTRMKLSAQPYLMEIKTVDDIVNFLQLQMDFRTDKLYAALQLPETSLAVGRTEMPDLPSSREALLTSPTRTDVVTFPRILDQTYDADTVIIGQADFTINVRKR